MDYKSKIILGTIFLILGIFSLVIGILMYIDTSGLNALFIDSLHLYVFEYLLARLLIIWGLALISAAIVLFVMAALKKEFKSKKPMVIAIAILIIGLLFTGAMVYEGMPPSFNAKADLSQNAQYTQVGSNKNIIYNVSSYSDYQSTEYFNVSLNGTLVFNQSISFRGYENTSFCIPSSTFSDPGNYTVTNTISHGTAQRTYKSWINVKPDSPMHLYISGPSEATEGYTGNYSVHVTGGYGPYQVLWNIAGENTHHISGNTTSFTFGDYQYGYTVEACVFDKYGAENTSSITVYLASNLSSSFSCSYPQLDQCMTDTFNGSIFSDFANTGVGPYSYSWYEDGTLFSSSENSTYKFLTPGIYNISLEVKDSENQTSEYSKNIQVNPLFGLWSYYPNPPPYDISGSQCVDFWYNVTGGTWLQNVSGYGHYSATFYVNGGYYVADNSFFSDDIGHYEFTLSSYVLNSGENSFKVVVTDGVGQTSVLSIEIDYSN